MFEFTNIMSYLNIKKRANENSLISLSLSIYLKTYLTFGPYYAAVLFYKKKNKLILDISK